MGLIAQSQPPPATPLEVFEQSLKNNKTVVCATFSSLSSTLFGYPLDSLKSRLQATRGQISLPGLAQKVWREEGVAGYYRGVVIPLLTISAVRAASFTMYTGTKNGLHERGLLTSGRVRDVALAGGLGGGASGSILSIGSAPFELVKIRRQLEYSIAEKRGQPIVKPPSTMDSVRDIVRVSGVSGLFNGFRLHLVRDSLGTALYFAEYDTFRSLLGRLPSGSQGPQPTWLPFHVPESIIPFTCGSVAGVTSWAIIYPFDVVKTKVQQRALAGEAYRPPMETFLRLVRGTDPAKPKSILGGLARLYRGLGISAGRSVITHGMLWTIFDLSGSYIDTLPNRRAEPPRSN